MRSFEGTADPKAYEFQIKVDDDDEATLKWIDKIKTIHPLTTVHVTPRGSGYSDIGLFSTMLAKASTATWVTPWNDDITWIGGGWDRQLAEVPTTGFVVQPEMHKLGGSTYMRAEGGPTPIVPNGCWEKFGYLEMMQPADSWLDTLLRVQNHWKTWWLKDNGFWHKQFAYPLS